MVPCPFCFGDGRLYIEEWDYGHACGGDEKLCQTKCPIPIDASRWEPCPYCNGEGMVDP